MNTATKLGAYVLGLAAIFGGAAGVGKVVGPTADARTTPHDAHGSVSAQSGSGSGHDASDGHDAGSAHTHGPGGAAGPAVALRGVEFSQDGYTFVPRTSTVPAGRTTDFRFTITGPGGRPVTDYATLHDKKMHFIVARRDLSGFQHLHPVEAGGGIWSVPLRLPAAGTYRAFADFQPAGAAGSLTLGVDLSAPGDFTPVPLPPPFHSARTDGGYEVTLTGDLTAGADSELTFEVSRNGRPVTDLQPYLAAYGHLVALRQGDLAYLHVHPDGAPGDGSTRPGPAITFHAEVPSQDTYRLYLDFKHQGRVHTAEFTAVTRAATAPVQEHSH